MATTQSFSRNGRQRSKSTVLKRTSRGPFSRPFLHPSPHPHTTTPVHDTCDRSTTSQKNSAPPPHRPTPLSAHLFTILETAQALEYRRGIQRLRSSPHPTFHTPPQHNHPHLFTILATALERRRKTQQLYPSPHRPTPLSTHLHKSTTYTCSRLGLERLFGQTLFWLVRATVGNRC